MDKFTNEGSGWNLQSVDEIVLEYYGLEALTGGSTFKELPESLTRKKACIYVKNNDDKCLVWATLSALFTPEKNAGRVSHYKPYENHLKTDGITFPADVKDVQKFADINNLVINVFGWENDSLTIYHTDKNLFQPGVCSPTINLLLYQSHYVWIKNMTDVTRSLNHHRGVKYFCLKCLSTFNDELNLDLHIKDCNVIVIVSNIMMGSVRLRCQNLEHLQSLKTQRTC